MKVLDRVSLRPPTTYYPCRDKPARKDKVKAVWRNSLSDSERAALIDSVRPLCWKMAFRYTGGLADNSLRKQEVDELYSAGVIGATEAATRFDPGRGIKFITYATHWIRNGMQHYRKESCCRGFIRKELRGVAPKIHSLDESIDPSQGATFNEIAFLEERSGPLRWTEAEWDRLLSVLTPQHADMVKLYYRDGHAVAQIAERYQMSRQWAWMTIRRSLKLLRGSAEEMLSKAA